MILNAGWTASSRQTDSLVIGGIGFLAVLITLASATVSHAELPSAEPDEVGIRPGFAADIERHVQQALDAGKAPGCVVVVGRRGKIVLQQAWGNRQVEPSVEPMTADTVFDMASLTKPVATATSVMRLVERGDLRVRDRVVEYLPEFTGEGKEKITVEQLLIHTSGLPPVMAADDFANGWSEAYEKMCALKLRSEPGEVFRYSDIGFLLLGELVARTSGKPLNEFAKQNIYEPLGMTRTTFCPPESSKAEIAPTEKLDGEWLRGTVHDPRARLLDGVAGHAGLFSTAADLAIYAQAMIDIHHGASGGFLQSQTVRFMTRPRDAGGNQRGLGWDMQSVYSRNRGEMMSEAAFGHGGFTGTAMWIDPDLELFVIFLSNRLHPSGNGAINGLAGRIGTIASAACSDGSATSPTHATRSSALNTRLGIDVLADDDFRLLRDQRVGLVTNHTGQSASGELTTDLLAKHPEVNLVALFSPEHGIRGQLDQAQIADSVDENTGLPVHSLYGETRKPTADQLKDIDTLVFDIQDIGCRFYTYISTLGLALEAAGEQGVGVVVLDRPNPLGGHQVEGPMLDAGAESFVAFHSLPIRHGMTVGELAQMMNRERSYGAELTVVKLEDWRRDALLFDTGLPWINTSPNMRSLTQAMLYLGVGVFETTNISVGRGTDTPFQVLGAPWIDARFAEAIQSQHIAGLEVLPITFTPVASKHAGARCGGAEFIITDWQAFRPMDLAWAIGLSLHDLYGEQWEHGSLPRLLGSQQVYRDLLTGKTPRKIKRQYSEDLSEFRDRRQPYLLY